MAGRFIKLYDKILKWEWYSDINTFRLFIHLLLKANYKDQSFKGKKILRGQVVTSLTGLASQTGLSVRQVRVSLDKLKMTGEVTSSAYARYRIITIVRYDEYQANDRLSDKQMTGNASGKRQANDKQMTSTMATSIDNIEQIEQIEKDRNIEHSTSVSAKRFTPPTPEDLHLFCQENGITIDEDRFMNYYQSNGWKVGRNSMKDWKATARNWAKQDQKKDSGQPASGVKKVVAQDYEQRDYSEIGEESMSEQMARLRRLMEEGL